MRALPEIQARFYAAIMTGAELAEGAVLEVLEESAGRARRRLAAYRRGVFGNLCNALETSYPVVGRIVGTAFFREAARQYILANQSRSGDLNDYGDGFAAFLGSYPHARDLPYLADVARLEWTLQAARNAGEPAPPDFSMLASVPADRYGDLRFELKPGSARLESPWPLHDIWRVNQPTYAGDMEVDFAQGSRLVLWRHRHAVRLESLAAAEAVFLDALSAGMPLASAAATALERDAGFEFGARLQQWITGGLLHRAVLENTAEQTP